MSLHFFPFCYVPSELSILSLMAKCVSNQLCVTTNNNDDIIIETRRPTFCWKRSDGYSSTFTLNYKTRKKPEAQELCFLGGRKSFLIFNNRTELKEIDGQSMLEQSTRYPLVRFLMESLLHFFFPAKILL